MSIQSSYISITNRCEMDIKGVKDIVSYDCDKVVLELEDSNLIICGSDFNVKKIDVENKTAFITGHVDSMAYTHEQEKRHGSILSSLFR